MKRCLLCLLFALTSTAAHAQLAVYVMGSAGHLSGYPLQVGTITQNSSLWSYGGTLGVYDNFLRLGPIKLGSDVRGFIETKNNNTGTNTNQLRGALVGLRLAGSAPLVPFKPYIQAELGGGSTNFGVNSSRTGGLIYQVQLGADFTVFPHLDVRGEYGVGQFVNIGGLGPTSNYSLQQLGAGAVLRF